MDEPTWGWLHASLRLATRLARKEFLCGIDIPILLASAGLETFVSPQSHRRAAGMLPDCTLVELPASKHEPFLERDPIRNRWLEAIDRFITERVDRPSACAPSPVAPPAAGMTLDLR